MEYTNLTKEQIQTIIHYRKNKTKFYSLSNDEINALFEFLQESFLCIVFKQEKFLFKVDKRKDWKEYRLLNQSPAKAGLRQKRYSLRYQFFFVNTHTYKILF